MFNQPDPDYPPDLQDRIGAIPVESLVTPLDDGRIGAVSETWA